MNILIAGASGFIGAELVARLSKSHQVTVLGRDQKRLERQFPQIQALTWDTMENADATAFDLVINLSGSNIGAKRWSPAIKDELIQSRTQTNERLIDWICRQNSKPRYFSASAVGIYGAQAQSPSAQNEATPIPKDSNDFLQQIGIAWEQSLQKAVDAGIPVTMLRFGVVLKKGQGMLKKIELPYQLGLGSVLATGEQYLSWIHYEDLVEAVEFLIEHPNITGPINITAPQPLPQKEFAAIFAKVLHRPMFLKTPAWFINTVFGEMGDMLLLKGQRIEPQRLLEAGFKFKCPDLGTALIQEYLASEP